MCHGMPRSCRVAQTLAEDRACPALLTADQRALCHLERFHQAPDADPPAHVVACCATFLCRPTPGRLRRRCGRQSHKPFTLTAGLTGECPFERYALAGSLIEASHPAQ
ncbi:hypothetical protein MRX96_004653 [Rhipicephalus microplus]